MPELPEVETICRGIRPHIIDRAIEKISYSGKKLRIAVPIDEIRDTLIGRRITGVRRRAKFILVEMEDKSLLAIHLGMTGNLGIFSPERKIAKHCHLQFLLSDGMELRYADARRFGSIQALSSEEAREIENSLFRTTGPEPFSDEFTADYLFQISRGRNVPVKSFIMTNQVVAGVGNIYANESLFQAGIDPNRSASSITFEHCAMLITRIREVLSNAIACGGSTISDYVNANQEGGYFQINFQVYGRGGEICKSCNSTIVKVQIRGRTSYYCPKCQR
ncbi:bifunctional DNA-formamidopyrimidine glycosylase/DNA-(apurinic or apyrimidinic site) lyase [Desulfopila aestuarii]|uniref:Formamidopyrimidine-DNA glycosylase n=1 Tax=Desulfopila aestuarii DSM 18488 TaxID=1121416 RepID=A0A1M7YFM6_9BACT|nr:bifunctional DNA-formamidopyrimidine glycosylase/DNA-(apurinic or apyrimidinic site) lyase [Desulfopila aestuarii]SHO51445.1 DNA-(apurinic or apyrimidinic site) lyase [Desulfopila aestuarii DSM 18488]